MVVNRINAGSESESRTALDTTLLSGLVCITGKLYLLFLS